jgi:hypothetical protein
VVTGGIAPATLTTITAKNNIFDPATPVFFIDVGNMAVDASGPVSGNAAYVEALYRTLLKRTGNVAPGGDAAGWVKALDQGALTRQAVAAAISHSPEALGVVVDGLYLKLLGRQSDPGGRAAFVAFLAQGGTVEQVTAFMLSSPEYAAKAGADGAFVQSLYGELLGRTGANAEVAGWEKAMTSVGRAAVINAFLSSAEYRADVVQQLYGFNLAPAGTEASLFDPVLHRAAAPGAGEINSWVNSPLDTLAIETALAGSGEFFANG